MSELLETLVHAFVAFVRLVAEILGFVIEGSVTIIGYVCSRRFRDRKTAEWNGSRSCKFLHLGFSGVCLAALVAIPIWLSLPAPESGTGVKKFEAAKQADGEEFRFRLSVTNKIGDEHELRVAVKEGGIGKILGTKTVQELKGQIKGNVVIVSDQKTNQEPNR